MKVEYLVCDLCKFKVNVESVLMWYRVDIQGIDTTSFGEPFYPVDLCSQECIVNYIKGNFGETNE